MMVMVTTCAQGGGGGLAPLCPGGKGLAPENHFSLILLVKKKLSGSYSKVLNEIKISASLMSVTVKILQSRIMY